MNAPDGPPRLDLGADGRATITLQRPAHRNRLHREDLAALQVQFAQVAADRAVRVLVITGQGSMFCAGFHLGEMQPAGAAGDPQSFERTVNALEALPQPTVARLNGGVFGGATDLALACDFRVGVQGMALRMPAARLGLHYYTSGLQRCISRLGLGTAKRLFLLAEEIDATELLRIGYLDQLVAADRLDGAVDALCAALQTGAPLAVDGMKASLNEIAGGRLDAARCRERERRCAQSSDLVEGLAAFAQRRPPRFSGR